MLVVHPEPNDPPTDVPARDGARRYRILTRLAGLLLLVAAALEVLALLPDQGGSLGPLRASPDVVAAHLVLAAGLAVTAALCAVPDRRLNLVGAAVAAGIVVCTLGLVVADVGSVLTVTRLGPGLQLEVAALVVAGGGVVLGLVAQPLGSVPSGRAEDLHPAVGWLTLVASALLGVALVPAWDRYQIVYTVVGRTQTTTAGNAFSAGTPGLVTAGTLLTAAAFAVVPVVAVVWRPARAGVLLTVGVLVAVASQVVSAFVGILHPSLDLFVSPSAAGELGAVLHVSLTWWWVLEVVAGLGLSVLVVARWWTPAGGSLLDSY